MTNDIRYQVMVFMTIGVILGTAFAVLFVSYRKETSTICQDKYGPDYHIEVRRYNEFCVNSQGEMRFP